MRARARKDTCIPLEEVAAVLGRPKRSVERDWTFVRAWLRRELGGA